MTDPVEEEILTPEEVESILQRLCGYHTREDIKRWREEPDWKPPEVVPEVEWNYGGGEALETTDIRLTYVNDMTDPVALWRRQNLCGYFGYVQKTMVVIILGTDEGLGIPAGTLTGRTFKDIATQIKGDEHWALVWSLLPLVVLDHLSDDCHEC